jgi:hypothetical protein
MAEQQDQPPEMPDTKAAEAQPLGEAAEQEPASREEQDRREEARVPIHYKTEIRSLGDAYPAIVRDLSRWGLMAESDAPFAVRSYVYVVFPGLGSIPGRVTWTNEGRFGLNLLEPITDYHFERLIRILAPDLDEAA